jgi:nucleoside phosphorylase
MAARHPNRVQNSASPLATVVLYALPEEVRPIRGYNVRTFHSGAGIGNAARRAADIMAAHHDRVDCLLICGFAGGLSEGLRPGDILIGGNVLDASAEYEQGKLFVADADLFEAAESVRTVGYRAYTGTLVTVDTVATTPAEKIALRHSAFADAVDMETAGAARVAEAREVPWLSIRAITDGVQDELPFDFNAFTDEDGNPDRNEIIRATLSQPWKIPSLIRLGTRSSLAANNLAHFLNAFLQQLPQ